MTGIFLVFQPQSNKKKKERGKGKRRKKEGKERGERRRKEGKETIKYSFHYSYTYAQVKRADEARLAGSKRSKNQGPCQAQDWSVERKEDVSFLGEDFLGTAYN